MTIENLQSLFDLFTQSGNFTLSFKEEDETTEQQPEAGHFLKRDGKRYGRDMELYRFISNIGGDEGLLCMLLEELALPARAMDESFYQSIVPWFLEQGSKVFPDRIEEWKAVLA